MAHAAIWTRRLTAAEVVATVVVLATSVEEATSVEAD
jgi:hypothetical protein